MTQKRFKVGISACLLGLKYRYDGTSKFNQEIVDALREVVDFIPVCPEVECGLGIPRPPMRLELGPDAKPRLKVIESGEDKTDELRNWAEFKIEQLCERDIAAFIFKSKSPSCALRSAQLFKDGELVRSDAQGLFTEMLRARLQTMPAAEETEVNSFLKQLGVRPASAGPLA